MALAGEKHAFICQALAKGEDGGALQMLAEQLLEPEVSKNAQDPGWRSCAKPYSERLRDCVKKTTDRDVREHAGQLIYRLVQETFAAPDRYGRLAASFLQSDDAYGWINLKHLLEALKISQTAGALELLSSIINNSSLPIRARSWALVAFGEMGGSRPACVVEIAKAVLLSPPDLGFNTDGRIKALVGCGFLTLEQLCSVLAQPQAQDWFEEIENVLVAQKEKLPTARLLELLKIIVAGPAPVLTCLYHTANVLYSAPRNVEQTGTIIAALMDARVKSDAHADKEQYLSILESLLSRFEDAEGGILRIPANPGPEAAISITNSARTETVDGTGCFGVDALLVDDVPKLQVNNEIYKKLPPYLQETMLPTTQMRTRNGFAVLALHAICKQASIEGLAFLLRTRTPAIKTLYFIEKDDFGDSRVDGYGFLLDEAAMHKANEAISRVFAWSAENIDKLAHIDFLGAAGDANDIRHAIENPVICFSLSSSSDCGVKIPGHEDGDSPAYLYSWLRSVQQVIKTALVYKQHVLHSVGVLG